MIKSDEYFSNYHGHKIDHLTKVHKNLQEKAEKRKFIWLAGDSSLDNKYWFTDIRRACNGYEHVFDEPYIRPDVCYWLNKHIHTLGYQNWAAINTAVEESSLNERRKKMFEQDKFIRDNITAKDLLVVSVGGNDIAAKPKLSTLLHLGRLVFLTKKDLYRNKSFKHLVNIFKDQTEEYINSLLVNNKPRKLIVCTMYYPCLEGKGWADKVLKLCNYNTNPEKVHDIIKLVYSEATSKIEIPGVKTIIPVPLYELMNHTDESHYVERVEPSIEGGRIISQGLLAKLGFINKNEKNESDQS